LAARHPHNYRAARALCRTRTAVVDTWRSGVPGAFANAIAHLVLPVLVLAVNILGNVARMTRAALLNETARAHDDIAVGYK
jgi:ABC-type dipeptide/oligopeptide/nickel transport system permease component